VPPVALVLVGAALMLPVGLPFIVVAVPALFGAVLAAVHHAEVVAHRVDEPFGTLILAVAVTVIEVALIVSMMLAGGPDKSALPRDTIFRGRRDHPRHRPYQRPPGRRPPRHLHRVPGPGAGAVTISAAGRRRRARRGGGPRTSSTRRSRPATPRRRTLPAE
jgi:hypothetical protein